ncbi:unnamed protein product [Cladocopium goreaui]|uniref:Uncharacterized protein n=1 Tax=Cladocopium goreaui TaxID=2562237 RepID=A0A9P1C9H3_9DINO|nr:unnamed protein product [Cladocopium goreaui]
MDAFARCREGSHDALQADFSGFESAETASQTKSDSALREELLKKLIDRELLGATRQILVDTVIDQLPLRELPPGNTSSLYIMYLAYMRTAGNDATPCSKSTFYSVANIWKKCLKFRRKSDHDFSTHASLCNELLLHYKEQWQNRSAYWQARSRSQQTRDLLCCIIDSYDKAKLLLPVFPHRRVPKRSVYELCKRNFPA